MKMIIGPPIVVALSLASIPRPTPMDLAPVVDAPKRRDDEQLDEGRGETNLLANVQQAMPPGAEQLPRGVFRMMWESDHEVGDNWAYRVVQDSIQQGRSNAALLMTSDGEVVGQLN